MLVCRYPLSHWSLSAWFSLDWTTFFSSLNFAVFVFLTLQPGELQPTLRKRRKFSLLDNLRVGWVEGREKERLQVKWWRTTTRQEKRLVWAFLSCWMESWADDDGMYHQQQQKVLPLETTTRKNGERNWAFHCIATIINNFLSCQLLSCWTGQDRTGHIRHQEEKRVVSSWSYPEGKLC